MTGMLMALFLYLLLRSIQPKESTYACYGCYGRVRFNRSIGHFVHDDTGKVEAISQPEDTVDPTDPDGDLLVHWATPIDYP